MTPRDVDYIIIEAASPAGLQLKVLKFLQTHSSSEHPWRVVGAPIIHRFNNQLETVWECYQALAKGYSA